MTTCFKKRESVRKCIMTFLSRGIFFLYFVLLWKMCHLPSATTSSFLPSAILLPVNIYLCKQNLPIQTNSDPYLSRDYLPIRTHSDPFLSRGYKFPAVSTYFVSSYPSFIASTSHRENPNQRTRNLSARIQLTKGQHHQYLKEREDEDLFQYQRDLWRVKTYVEACFT